MSESAFSAGVRPGGLTDETQIRILICYIVQNFAPVTQQELQDALWSTQLVNYFELCSAISELCRIEQITEKEDGYHITDCGTMTANDLATSVPRSVRERAMDGMMKMRAHQLKLAHNRAEIRTYGDEYQLRCKIDEMGRTLFDCSVTFPELELAEYAKSLFIENGDSVYQLLIAGLTKDKTLASHFFEKTDF